MTMTASTANAQRFREFKMPDVGEGLTEAEILKWYVKPGDTVTDGQVVCEVETAKAAVELPIPYDGVVHELHFGEGVTVDVGTVIISVDTDPGAGPAAAPAAGSRRRSRPPRPRRRTPSRRAGRRCWSATAPRRPRPSAGPRKPQAAVPAQPEPASAALQAELNGRAARAPTAAPAITPAAPAAAPVAPAANGTGAAAAGRPLAKPPVRKLAKDLGIDLAAIAPTGPDGIITREDVHAAAAPAAAPSRPPRPRPSRRSPPRRLPAEPGLVDAAARERRVPVKGVRKATAQAMVASAFTAPHVTEFITVDVTRTMKLVQELKQDPDMAGLRVNPLLLVAKAFLVAIKRHPEVNASWDEARQEIVYKHYVNLGIAAATPRGLIVPNIKDAGVKTLPDSPRRWASWSPPPARARPPRRR